MWLTVDIERSHIIQHSTQTSRSCNRVPFHAVFIDMLFAWRKQFVQAARIIVISSNRLCDNGLDTSSRSVHAHTDNPPNTTIT